MRLNSENFQIINEYLNQYGLDIRGIVIDKLDEDNIQQSNGTDKAIMLIGNIGSTFWNYFIQSNEYLSQQKNPLDSWCTRIINDYAEIHGIKTIFPSDGPPYAPFQQWAKAAESGQLYHSPIGALMHLEYGLWHAYRGAFVFEYFDENINEQLLTYTQENKSPCESCTDKPCLSTCPIVAFTETGYDYQACAQYLVDNEKNNQRIKCNELGCLARLSCPVATEKQYKTEHHLLHLNRFKSAHAK